MSNANQLVPTDIYGTWTVFLITGQPGVEAHKSRFRITHRLNDNDLEHILVNLTGVKWNEGEDVVLAETKHGNKYVLEGRVRWDDETDYLLSVGSTNLGVTLDIDVSPVPQGAGGSGTGQAGRP